MTLLITGGAGYIDSHIGLTPSSDPVVMLV